MESKEHSGDFSLGSSDFVRLTNKGIQNGGAYGTDLKKGTRNIVVSERDLQQGESGRQQ